MPITSVVAKRHRKQIETFKQQAFDVLMELGAKETEDSNVFLLDTRCGDLRIKIQTDWLQCHFVEPKRAAEAVRGERFHAESGKWLWAGRDCLSMFKNAVSRILDEPLNISMDKATFLARKERFMAEYAKVPGSSAGQQFIGIDNELSILASATRGVSAKAAAFFTSPPAVRIEAMFRDFFPVLEQYSFPAHGTVAMDDALNELKVNVWMQP